ncbi:MAG: hypothetical protein A4E47_01298 [Methanosaeta sp. PtaU1.Bin028]|nr:MAG: hypothetical protein A4E47_01298 [Methanosaeta sp. PtaU1.Bin028]
MDNIPIFGIVYETLQRSILGREIFEIDALDACDDLAAEILKLFIVPYIHADIILLALGHS